MDQLVPKPGFEINRSRGDGLPIARLPTLGIEPVSPYSYQFQVDGVDSYLAALHQSIGDTSKAIESSIHEAAKALGATPPQALTYAKLNFLPDPANYGLMSWPGIQPESLRKVARENIVPQLVIRSRTNDLRRYSGLSTHPWSPGWKIVMRDALASPSRQDLKDIREAENFIANCSREQAYVNPRDRDNHQISGFEGFLCGMADDTFTFDGWSIWTDRDRAGRVRAFANLPAGLIRLALPREGYRGDPDLFACLIDETNTPVKAFTRDEMTWRVRNVRNDPSVLAYGWSEVEIAILLIQAFQGAIQLNTETFCYSEDTEVLTKNGWKRFNETSIDLDEYATLNTETGVFEYQKATDHTWVDYEGDMYWVNSRSVDLFVTPNHRMVVQYRPECYRLNNRKLYEIWRADELYDRLKDMSPASRNNYCLPMVSTWRGTEILTQTFAYGPPQCKTTRDISGDDYCALLGAYLAEGNLADDPSGGRNRIQIHQMCYSKGAEPYRQLLIRILGQEPGYTGNWFYMGWHEMAAHLRQFGEDCYSKRIPQIILDATPRQQRIFWDYFLLGDGSTSYTSLQTGRVREQHHIATTSKIMADQFQELAQKMGVSATICKVDARKYVGNIKGRGIHATTDRYDVYLKQSDMHSVDMEKGFYKGKIGCVSVPNGTLYVRRGGKAAWCGNTRNSIPNGMLLLKGDYWQQEQIDALMREWTNMKRGLSKMWGLPVLSVPEDGDVELMPFMDLKGQEIRYKDHLNLMAGVYCAVSQYPVRRLGLFASGGHRDNQPLPNESTEIQGVDDPGLPALLTFIENTVNEYLLQPNWPQLRLIFMNKSPKEDARSYAEQKLARTWGEARATVDQKTLVQVSPEWLKPMAEILDLCPDDPAKIGPFSALATIMLESKLGISSESGSGGGEGSPFPSATDPAKSLEHGHRSGVRRNSAKEEAQASGSEP